MLYKVSDINPDQEITGYLCSKNVFTEDLIRFSLQDFSFNEFTLAELGLPSANELLASTLAIKDQIGLRGWWSNGKQSPAYKGFSLTYNPEFYKPEESIYHQTWGSPLLTQNFGRVNGLGNHSAIRNTYYDTYAFRKVPDIVNTHLGGLFSNFYCPLLRSRAAFFKLFRVDKNEGWHVDEFPYQMFRINIPLQTHEDHILEINGTDEYGNSLVLTKHLEVGKVYIWNTRIPHRVTVKKPCIHERIHLVLGFGTWVTYDPIADTFAKSKLHGLPLKTIINQRLFLKDTT